MDAMSVVINDVSDVDMLLTAVGRSDIPAPEAKYETTNVEGVDGSINRFLYYDDVQQKIEFNILEDYNIKAQIRKIKAWLLNATSYYFTDDDVYRKVKRVTIDGIKNDMAEYGDFEVTFVCDPFEYARDVDLVTLTGPGTLDNFGTYNALPLMKIYGSGQSTVTVGETQFAIDLQKEYAVVDSTIKNCYYQNTNLNTFMDGEFPELAPGTTQISWTGSNITKIEVERRCRYL